MRTRAIFASVVLVGMFAASSASAQVAQGFAVDRFEPSERGSDWFTLDSLDLRGSARPAFGVVGDYNVRPLVIYDGNGNIRESVVRNDFILHAGAAFVFLNRFRIAADMPFQLFADGHEGFLNGVQYNPPANDQALGDLRLSADARLFGEYGDVMTLAIGAQVSLPTGSQDNYMSDGQVRVMPRAVVAGDVGPVAYSARLGIQYRGNSNTIDGGAIDSEFNFGGSVGLRAFDKALLIGPEIYGSTTFDNAFDKQSTPLELLFGPHIFLKNGLRFGAGAGTGLTRGFGSPVARALFNIEWVAPLPEPVPPDRDHDGIYDRDDACPDVPGVASPDPAKNGCPPPPPDRDGDGILDRDDACPDTPGVHDADPKYNGCPPSDRDHDGILDRNDACPDVPGVNDPDPKKNGCPPDRDNDGIADADDACPDTPGIKSSNPKFNGCPADIDGDGILNDVDACPEEKGLPNADPAKNGCPRAYVQAGQIKILDQVKFKTDSAAIVVGKDSDDILQAVLKILQDHSEIHMVSIEGHTDSTGKAAHNKTLSAARAKSVMTWLIKHGIDKSRLSSIGYGQERPIGDNATPEGKAANRRVEFHIVEDKK
jgi:outer membrane protein OmpA-like peptidoglycan-associated protein